MAIKQGSESVRLLWKRAGMLALLLVLIGSLFAVWGVWHKKDESAVLRRNAEAELADLQGREAKLTADIGMLQTDRGKEAELRQDYDVGAPGEHLVVIVNQSATPTPHATTTLERIASWFSFW